MAMIYYVELHQLRSLKSKAVIENNLQAYFDCLEEIYIAISFKLNKKEQDNVEAKLKTAKDHLSVQLVGSVAMKVRQYSMNSVKDILKSVDKFLIKQMHKNGMIFPSIEAKGLKTLVDRYGVK